MVQKCPGCHGENVVKDGYSRRQMNLKGGRRQRFKCGDCGRRFSHNVFSLSYRNKHWDPALNAKIFWDVLEGPSLRSTGRRHKVSEHCVRIRTWKLAVRGIYFQAIRLAGRKIGEGICVDGLENFAISQYDVNNINHAVGEDSLFIYDFNICTLNRKGRMSPWQRGRLAEIEGEHGRYDPKNIRKSVGVLFRRLHEQWGGKGLMPLTTDEHFQYRRALRQDLSGLKFEHQTVSSKAVRNFQNILFPVNHADLVIRQKVGAFSRETICFSKTHVAMVHKYALFMIYKNFMAPQFTKRHVRRPLAHAQSPAQHIGLTDRILEFEEIFQSRDPLEHTCPLNEDWKHFVAGTIPTQYARNKKFKRKQIPETPNHLAS